uniref:Radial spoke head 1 homolog n=1 Tax=Cacopsylla melanoneura TaxID=428564 RepID=A0A8D9BI17_9HEMI
MSMGSAGTGGVDEQEPENPLGLYEGGRNTHNQRHGTGRTLLPSGDYYEGCYNRNLRHGKGLYVFANRNGARYEGEYRFGLRSGQGVFYYPDGTKYEGEWKKNLRHGFGTYFYLNGDTYTGAWFKSKRQGIGTYTYTELGIKTTCAWANNEIAGGGKIEYPVGGVTFHGSFDKHRPVGRGLFAFPLLNCMQLGVYERKPIEQPPEEEPPFDMGSQNLSEADFDKPLPGLPPSEWWARDVVEYDGNLMPPPPVTKVLPDTPDTASIQSASLLTHHSEQDECWEGEGEMLEEEEEALPSWVEENQIEEMERLSNLSIQHGQEEEIE